MPIWFRYKDPHAITTTCWQSGGWSFNRNFIEHMFALWQTEVRHQLCFRINSYGCNLYY